MKHLFLFAFALNGIFSLEEDFFDNIVIPSEVSITVDESIYIKIKNPIEKQTSCEYQAPGEKTPSSTNSTTVFGVKLTDDGCGIKIEKVKETHAGVWKLISTFKNGTFENTVRGTSHVTVKDKVVVSFDENRIYSSTDDFAPPNVDLNYCYVSKETGMMSKMTGIDTKKCMIPQDIENEDFRNGEWLVRVGVKGVSNEISFSVNIQSTDEAIETIVKRADKSVQLLCHVKNLKNVLTFCRFERVDDDDDGFGLNLEDGLASGNYRYFGQGFAKGDCGLEIIDMNINLIDKTQWNCIVGLTDAADAMNDKIAAQDKKVYKHSSVLDASDNWDSLKIVNVEPKIYFVDNQSAIIQCNTNNPLNRCWFQHPIHRILSVSDKKIPNADDDFQYYGSGFKMGHCGIKIKSFYFADAGNWRCGVGQSESMKEDVKTINVEVKASYMMSITKQIEDFSRNSIVLQCRVIPNGGLASCHFFPPAGEPFSISDKITSSNAINGNYYFDPNRKLSEGYCTVVIRELMPQHAGKWLCSGRPLGHENESYDSIYVTVDGLRGASFSYLSIAITLPLVAVLALSILGVKVFRKMKQRQQVRREQLATVSLRYSVASSGSGDSTLTVAT